MYNIGIIGTGDISKQFVEGSKFVSNVVPYAIYSRSMVKAIAFKEENNLLDNFDNLSNMLSDCNIDIIYIASPNSLHFEQAKLAIEAKKHCLIEKPIALTPAEIDYLFKLANANNVYIQEAYVSLPYNTFNQVKDWIQELGEIGKVDLHLNQQSRHFQNYINGQNFNVFDGKMGGGVLRDLGPYPLFPLISWFGSPMQSHYFSTKNELNADETTLVLAHFETFSATICVSKMFHDTRPSVISGDNGYIEIDHINEMNSVKLYNSKKELIAECNKSYPHRMAPQLEHFIQVLDSKSYLSQLYTQQLSSAVHTIIAGNYQ